MLLLQWRQGQYCINQIGDRMALTPDDIAQRLDEAYHSLSRLPRVKVDGFKGNWPAVIREFVEAYGYNEASVRPGPPSAKHITEMDETLRWLLWLNVYEARLLWLRAGNARWKTISWRLGKCVKALQTDWKAAVLTIHFAIKHNVPIKAREPVFSKPMQQVFER